MTYRNLTTDDIFHGLQLHDTHHLLDLGPTTPTSPPSLSCAAFIRLAEDAMSTNQDRILRVDGGRAASGQADDGIIQISLA
jgi:hypothetical protein